MVPVLLFLPQSHHFGRVASHGDTKGSGQPEICQFQFARFIDEEILRLQVPVQNVSAVTVREAEQQLKPIENSKRVKS